MGRLVGTPEVNEPWAADQVKTQPERGVGVIAVGSLTQNTGYGVTPGAAAAAVVADLEMKGGIGGRQ